jgi:cysteine desulfurase
VEMVRLLPSGELDLTHFVERLESFHPTLVSLMAANNETGIVFPIADVLAHCAVREIPVHVDAVQAFGKLPLSSFQGADFLSLSSHKIYGPKGTGALVLRSGRKLIRTQAGGSQETKRRGGTENVSGIAGFGAACGELPPAAIVGSTLRGLRDRFEKRVLSAIEEVSVNGASVERLPNTTSLRVTGIPAEVLLGALDLDGVCISAGSACSSGSLSPSHVLLALGLSATAARECLRVSWGRDSTAGEVDTVADLVIDHVKRIRARKRN